MKVIVQHYAFAGDAKTVFHGDHTSFIADSILDRPATLTEKDNLVMSSVFVAFNVGSSEVADEYRNNGYRSLSVGDLITLEDTNSFRTYEIAPAGFRLVSVTNPLPNPKLASRVELIKELRKVIKEIIDKEARTIEDPAIAHRYYEMRRSSLPSLSDSKEIADELLKKFVITHKQTSKEQ